MAPRRRAIVALREVAIAFAVLCAFMFFGETFLRVMRLSERSLEVAGGVILLMVAIRMIFHQGGGAVLLGCDRLRKWLGDSVVSALEMLMGLVLTAIAVEMILAGLKRYFMEPG